jgi:hypothetical protein
MLIHKNGEYRVVLEVATHITTGYGGILRPIRGVFSSILYYVKAITHPLANHDQRCLTSVIGEHVEPLDHKVGAWSVLD